jgi:hypothetical protein
LEALDGVALLATTLAGVPDLDLADVFAAFSEAARVEAILLEVLATVVVASDPNPKNDHDPLFVLVMPWVLVLAGAVVVVGTCVVVLVGAAVVVGACVVVLGGAAVVVCACVVVAA